MIFKEIPEKKDDTIKNNNTGNEYTLTNCTFEQYINQLKAKI